MQQDNCDMEQSKHHDYYYPLPGSDPSFVDDAKAEASSHNPKHNSSSEDCSSYQTNKVHLNKYALAGAILASTNSILLGYGKL